MIIIGAPKYASRISGKLTYYSDTVNYSNTYFFK